MAARVELEVVTDGDGHIVEDIEAIAERMPREFIRPNPDSKVLLNSVYPPQDHLHAANPVKTPKGSFQVVGPDGWLEFANDIGIDNAVLYPSAGLRFGHVVNLDWAIALARAYNDWLYETYARRSDRFQGMGLVPMQEPAEAARELRRVVTELGFKGAMLPATGFRNLLGAKEYWPVYEEADRLGCAMGVHGGVHARLGMDQMNMYAVVNALGHPFSQAINMGSVIFNGVLDKYPNVRWGFLEAGVGWFLMCLERFDRAYETHVHADPRNELIQLRDGEGITEYVQRQIAEGRLFVGCEGNEPFIPEALEKAGSGFLMFSSDFPHEVNTEWCRKEINEVLEMPDVSDEDKAGILHKNAWRMYRFANGGNGG